MRTTHNSCKLKPFTCAFNECITLSDRLLENVSSFQDSLRSSAASLTSAARYKPFKDATSDSLVKNIDRRHNSVRKILIMQNPT